MQKAKPKSQDLNIKIDSQKSDSQFLTTNLQSIDKNTKFKKFMIIATGVSIVLTLAIGLIVNYLFFYPNSKNSDGIKNGTFVVNDSTLTSVIIVSVLTFCLLAYGIFLLLALEKRVVFDNRKETWTLTSIGFVGSFLDAIGVGSYGVAIGMMKATKTIGDDKLLPGTLTVGLAIPQMMEATIFVGAIAVDWKTLLILTACSVVGGIVGALIAKKINSQVFRIIIGSAMFVVAIIMILVHPNVAVIAVIKDGGTLGLTGWKLVVGIISFLILGATSALGLGMFAPSLAILTLLGMNTSAIFPIMSLAASAMMPPAAIKFFKDKNYLSLHSITFTLGGVFGTLCSFLVIFVGLQVGAGMDQDAFNNVLKWVAVVVVFYCSFLMLFDFARDYKKHGWKAEAGSEVI